MGLVTCPFCHNIHDFSTSNVCENDERMIVPEEYITEYDRVPPLWLLTVGFSRHGKTTYLAALTLVLENMSSVWQGMYDGAFGQETIDAIRQMRSEAMNGALPQKTEKNVLHPLLLGLHELPESGSRCLVMYDVAGEVFDKISHVQQHLVALKHVSTTWFLISLEDLAEDKEGRSITDLFSAYRSGMRKLQASLKGRNLIVVYTKADQLTFPPEIDDYILNDPFAGLALPEFYQPPTEPFSLQAYKQGMEKISGLLEVYTREKVKKGAAFINMVKADGMNLYFSAVSALGQKPDSLDTRLKEKARRYRVIDPFLWALTLQMKSTLRIVSLVVDGSSNHKGVYEAISKIWKQLAEFGVITTYYLGDSQPKSYPGQRPPATPPHRQRTRLIGSILEQSTPDTRILILTAGAIADLEDFANTPWSARIVIVLTDESQQISWPHTFIYREGTDPAPIVNALLNL